MMKLQDMPFLTDIKIDEAILVFTTFLHLLPIPNIVLMLVSNEIIYSGPFNNKLLKMIYERKIYPFSDYLPQYINFIINDKICKSYLDVLEMMDWKSDNPNDHIITIVISSNANDDGWFVYKKEKIKFNILDEDINQYDNKIKLNVFPDNSLLTCISLHKLITTYYKKVYPEYSNLIRIIYKSSEYWYPKDLIPQEYHNTNYINFPLLLKDNSDNESMNFDDSFI